MDNSKVIDIVLEYLRNKQNLTDLEKDILSSLNKLNEKPFDRSGTEQKLIENNIKYENMLIPMQLGDEAHLLPFAQLSDDEIWNNLYLQVLGLCLKELQAADIHRWCRWKTSISILPEIFMRLQALTISLQQ